MATDHTLSTYTAVKR